MPDDLTKTEAAAGPGEAGAPAATVTHAAPRPDAVAVMEAFLGVGAAAPAPGADADAPRRGPAPAVPGHELFEEVGAGGMGVVYRARDLALGRDVAVKLLQDRYSADSAMAARFLEEARITGRLQHPGVPPVHRVGALPDGRPYLVMKLIRGRTLDRLPAEAPGSVNALAVFEQIAQAVGYAHAHGVIHRDLKPSNVMVGGFGEVQVMDWGLAKVLGAAPAAGAEPTVVEATTAIHSPRDADTPVTRAGSVLGTPAYMPPEQAAGETEKIDRRADVFALGAILCYLLTGKPPYAGASADEVHLAAVRGQTAGAFARLDASGAEPALIDLARRCLAFAPDERPADASTVAAAVAALRAAAEERARQAEVQRARAEVRAAEQRKRRRVQLALAGSVVALLALAGGGLWWSDRQAADRATERRAEAARNRQALDAALDQAGAGLRKANPAHGEIDAALTQAGHRLPPAGEDDARARFAELTRARQFLGRLDEIARRALNDTRLDRGDYWREQYTSALADAGIDLAAAPTDELAERVRRSPVASRLAAALDELLAHGGPPGALELVNALDPDPGRVALRQAYHRTDNEAVGKAVAALDGRTLPAAFARFVGGHNLTPPPDAVRILVAAQAAHPDDFDLAALAVFRLPDDRADEMLKYAQIAMAVRPGSAAAYSALGYAFWRKKDYAAATAAFREVVRLVPEDPYNYVNLGSSLADAKDYPAAAAALREAIRLDPGCVAAHTNLGDTLALQGDKAGALAATREALRLNPNDPVAHNNIGDLLFKQKDYAAAADEFRAAVRLEPNFGEAHEGLGDALRARKDIDGAVTAYRAAVRLRVHFPTAYTSLAALLAQKSQPLAALRALRDGAEVDPAWAGDPDTRIRFESARCAILAGTGRGTDAPPGPARPALRREALDWLSADLAAWRQRARKGPNRHSVRETMDRWLGEGDLAGVREPAALAGLPAEERREWEQLWADVRQLRDATRELLPAPREIQSGGNGKR
jgi:tetratricopeptide (TPR) repeat protein